MKRRNKLAKDLEERAYHQRIIPNKKKHRVIEEEEADLEEELDDYINSRTEEV
jgi:hypothetical protein